jgi:radical SAM superfamily enzyme YgiQ (UPF0313 family)
MFKVLLCIPPDYDYNFPPLGTPALCAFLKKKSIPCQQLDLNLGYREFLNRHITVSAALSDKERKALLKPLMKKFFKEQLKGRYYSAFLPWHNDGIFPYLPYDNNSNSSFYFTERLLSRECLWKYLEDKEENTFYQFYEQEGILDFFDKEKINLLGISIISPSQAIASLTLGLLVKRNLPHIHINIGGQWPTLYRDVLLERKDLFRCFDSIIVFEGETPLFRLAESLKNKKNFCIRNVILQDTKADFSYNHLGEDLNLLPCPDFDGLPLSDYDGSANGQEISLTYETSRGCYWSRCAYCVDLPLPKPSYRRKRPELVARDMKELKKKYSAGYLMLGDPGVSPRQMLEVSKEILKEKLDIGWWSMARLDHGFNYEAFKIAARAGLRQVNFGFESASDRICGLLDKGNRWERSLRIIRDCAKAGIKVDLQTMLGLPQESFNDGLETVDFLIKNREFIYDVTFNTYYLTPANRIYQNPERYGIEYKNDASMPFSFFVPFKNVSGITTNEAQLLTQLYYDLLEKSTKETIEKKEDSSSKDVSEGWVEFRLNGESSKLNYQRDNETGNFIF